MASKTPELSLAVQYAAAVAGLPPRYRLRRWVARSLEAESAQVTLRFVAAAEGRALNAQFRGKDYATNVLSFAYAPPPHVAGDLVLCTPVLRAEARAQKKSLEAHCAHLVVHGMLHLQSYDHENDSEAARMEQRERDILARLGFPDPY